MAKVRLDQRRNAIAINIKATWERVFSVLVAAARRLNNRHECQRLPELTHQDRPGFIVQHWGPAALQKVSNFLVRIQQLETELMGPPQEVAQQAPNVQGAQQEELACEQIGPQPPSDPGAVAGSDGG